MEQRNAVKLSVLFRKLEKSLYELKKVIRDTNTVLKGRGVSEDLLVRLEDYDKATDKQLEELSDFKRSLLENDEEGVYRSVRRINALSSLIKTDARELLESGGVVKKVNPEELN